MKVESVLTCRQGREGKGKVSERDKSSSHATFLTRSRVTNRIGKYPAFGFVHKRFGNEFSRDMGLPGRHFIAKKRFYCCSRRSSDIHFYFFD